MLVIISDLEAKLVIMFGVQMVTGVPLIQVLTDRLQTKEKE